jgi:hypothetical protein
MSFNERAKRHTRTLLLIPGDPPACPEVLEQGLEHRTPITLS